MKEVCLMAKKKQSPQVQAYKKELKRIKSFISRAEKRGYHFENAIPAQPKRITPASVGRLKKITPETLYKKAKWYDPLTNKYQPAQERRKAERKESAQKAARTRRWKKLTDPNARTIAGQPPMEADSVISYMEDLISQWNPAQNWSSRFAEIKRNDKNILSNLLRGAIESLGREQVAKNIQAQAARVKDLAFAICYGYSGSKKDVTVEADLAAMAAIVWGRTLTVSEAKNIQAAIDALGSYEDPD